MKQTLLTITLSFVVIWQVVAGSMTITTTAAQDTRLLEAVGSIMNLGRPATGPEAKAWVIDQIRQAVQDYERRKAQALISPTPFDPN